MTTFIICQRCGKPMRPVFSDGTDVPTQGFCSCPPATGYGEDMLRHTSMLLDWRDAELARLRAALAEAERERDEARAKYTAVVSGLRNDRDMWRDAAYQAADVSEELDRSRRTIRALVVAARVTRLAAVGFAFVAGVALPRVHDEIRFGVNQAKNAELAGKE